MANSMTGFGRGEESLGGLTISVEIKSVNNRYCDIQLRMPRVLYPLETDFRQRCQQAVSRGKLDISVSFRQTGDLAGGVQVNTALAAVYDRALRNLGAELGRPWVPDMAFLAGLPDVVRSDDAAFDLETAGQLLAGAQQAALDMLVAAKQKEGVHLTADIIAACNRMLALLEQAEARAAAVPAAYRERLEERMRQLLSPEQAAFFDEQRLAAEVLIFTDKADVHEETVRLHSHLAAMKQTVARDEPVGKKLDFFCQEVNREVNTIGSKANDLQLTQLTIEMKSTLETIREQVQNIE